MPTKRIFDAVVLTFLLMQPALGLAKLELRRHARESDGAMGTFGKAMAGVL